MPSVNPVNPLRHMKVFSPDTFGMRRVDVIGVGASGSWLVLQLAKLGISNIHVWDFDTVAEHNLANQAFGPDDVGKPKVESLARLVKAQTGAVITTHNEPYHGQQQLGEVVFLLTDTMKSRKEIWQRAIKYKPMIKLMIETRMDADNGRVYAINPINPDHIKGWEATLYDDPVADPSVCGARITIGSTAMALACYATWAFMRWFAIDQGTAPEGDKLEQELLFGLRPPFASFNKFAF